MAIRIVQDYNHLRQVEEKLTGVQLMITSRTFKKGLLGALEYLRASARQRCQAILKDLER